MPPPGRGPALWRLVAYYAVLVGAMVGLYFWSPAIVEAVSAFGVDGLGESLESFPELGGQAAPGPVSPTQMGGWLGVAVAGVSMLGALAIMIPVVWSYIVIKRDGGYEESVVHTLMILPVAVTGIVVVVQNDLALAFSLAGIVAAVRFRTTLDDTKDAVYVFLAIGVGLAAGVQALGIALVLSLVFNVVNLVLWYTNFGNIYADQRGRTAPMGLADVLAGPESARKALRIGDQSLLHAMRPQELERAAASMARMERYLDAEATKHKDRKRYALLIVHLADVAETQPRVEAEIETHAARWRLAEILPGKGGLSVLEYLVRLRDESPAGALLQAVRKAGGDAVRAAEFRSLEGLKKRR